MYLLSTRGKRIEYHLRHTVSSEDLHRRYHEAGHAHLVKKYGGVILSIRCQEVNWTMPSGTEREKINITKMFLAGCAAQCILEGVPFDWRKMRDEWPIKRWTSSDDLRGIETARYSSFFRGEEHLTLLALEVHRELLADWYKVGKIAKKVPVWLDASGFAASGKGFEHETVSDCRG